MAARNLTPVLLCSLLLAAASARADNGPPADASSPADQAESLNDVRFVVGGVLANGPIYFGQRERATGFRPMFALRWGKLRISSSGAGGLIGEANAGGASAEVLGGEGWNVRLGVRIDRGRRIESDSTGRLDDLPRMRGTLRGRISFSQRLGEQSSLSLNFAPDLLGREGGTLMQLGYFRRLHAPEWLEPLGGQWSAYAGLTAGDDQYMQSYFGIRPDARRFKPYEAEGGLRNASLGLGWQRAFGEQQQWVLFGGAGVQRLLGSAAKAPFVERQSSWTTEIGLAYRH